MHQLKSQSRSAGLQYKRLSRPSEFRQDRVVRDRVNASMQVSREHCSMSAQIVEFELHKGKAALYSPQDVSDSQIQRHADFHLCIESLFMEIEFQNALQ